MLRRLGCPTLLLLLITGVAAHGQETIRLYEGPAPGSEDWKHEQRSFYSRLLKADVVANVANPTLTAFVPKPATPTGDATGKTAVVIAPGGGFHVLSIKAEGEDVAKWLSERGIAAFVLRYRLIPTSKFSVAEMAFKPRDKMHGRH